jgi:triacylglycerol lipase
MYDVPAFVDKIKHVTGNKNVSYVGHSAGTTQFLMGAAMRPDYYNENINYAALLAPIAHMSNIEVESLKTLAQPKYLEPAI